MVFELNWKSLPLGGIAWTLLWLGFTVLLISTPFSTPVENLVTILVNSSFWLGGIAFWRFVKDMLKSRKPQGFGK